MTDYFDFPRERCIACERSSVPGLNVCQSCFRRSGERTHEDYAKHEKDRLNFALGQWSRAMNRDTSERMGRVKG